MNDLPKKLKSKAINGWFVTYIDYNGQSAQFHTNLSRHLKNDLNFIGEDRGIYYFQFDKEEKIEAFLRIMKRAFDNLNVNTR